MAQDSQRQRRRSLRLPGYDYSWPGAYFITVCTERRECLFGGVADGEMEPNAYGEVVAQCWHDLPNHYPGLQVDAFVVMPNHVHGVLMVTVGAIHELPLPQDARTTMATRRRMLVSRALGRFKMNSAKGINALRGTAGARIWQRNYWEHVVRSGAALERIRDYIMANPFRWDVDPENPERRGQDDLDRAFPTVGAIHELPLQAHGGAP